MKDLSQKGHPKAAAYQANLRVQFSVSSLASCFQNSKPMTGNAISPRPQKKLFWVFSFVFYFLCYHVLFIIIHKRSDFLGGTAILFGDGIPDRSSFGQIAHGKIYHKGVLIVDK
ncbi:hypothetical protein KKF81_03960 [Candidatus Micrarchaeota archaeon]|nr:hypothetical protein [Candidatus Micrarchaeota archaeon]MBU1166080.1 hypothetical protein [Candidatus Micrarchaeota archaeon]MBU1886672.1 hypothetical protein [Candidatus Micrarchaeota archaeon]